MKQIKLGQVTMEDKSLPIKVLLNKYVEPNDFISAMCPNLTEERFTLVEADGLYFLGHQEIFASGAIKQHFKAFACRDDAFSYLEALGVIDAPKEP